MRKYFRGTALALASAFVLTLGATAAKADEWNQETILTINNPMVVPGATLAPGTYDFKLADDNGGRNVVHIFRAGDHSLIATAFVIRMHRVEPAGGPLVVAFRESAAGTTPAMKGWFYPGSMDGLEFLYPKAQRRVIARAETVEIPVAPQG
jgi:hypothetical protein